jgi:S-adenosylmethionine hydrolase
MRLTLVFLFLLILTGSCGEKVYTGNVNCDECYTEKPQNTDLIIDLTIANRFGDVVVNVYEGELEDNKLVLTDTVFFTPYYAYVKVDKKYAVRAEYKKGSETLYVVDGTKLKVLLVRGECDEDCYVIEGESMNATIKEEFLDF